MYTFQTIKQSFLPSTTKSCKNYFAQRLNNAHIIIFFSRCDSEYTWFELLPLSNLGFLPTVTNIFAPSF